MGLINIISPEKLGDKKVREIELRTRFFFSQYSVSRKFLPPLVNFLIGLLVVLEYSVKYENLFLRSYHLLYLFITYQIKLNYVFVFFQLFVIICLILARTGFAEGTAHFLALVDTEWVTITSVCSYTFIYPMLIICYLMGEVVPIKLVSLKQF